MYLEKTVIQKKYMYPNVCCSIIYNNQETEATSMSIDRRVDKWIKTLWYRYTAEYYLALKRNKFESADLRWMNIEPVIQIEVVRKRKTKYYILMQIYGI